MKVILENVSLKRGVLPLFSNVSLTVSAGELLEIVASNGVGKTSFLKMIAGFLSPAEGRVRFPQSAPLYLSVGSGFDNRLTAFENLQYLCALERQKPFCLPMIFERMNFSFLKDQLFGTLSSGQKQRLHLARLLMVKRSIWLLDEPLTSLDLEGETFFKEVCKDHQKQGGIILIASPKPLGMGKIFPLEAYKPSLPPLWDGWESL